MSPSGSPLPVVRPGRRAPSGRKLSAGELRSLGIVDSIYEDARAACDLLWRRARSDDTRWFIGQFMDPVELAKGKLHKLPSVELMRRAVLFLENHATGEGRTELRPKLAAALEAWIDRMAAARKSKEWADVEGRPATLRQFRAWREALDALSPVIIPQLDTSAEFDRALRRVTEWDEVLWETGHGADEFSLRGEVARLHNWPGDQWDSGDDFKRAQKRYKKRLKAARKGSGKDPVRDRILRRSLYLREGLLLNPVDEMEWLLAVLKLRWSVPEVVDPRPQNRWWRFLGRLQELVREPVKDTWGEVPAWVDAESPLDVPDEELEAVSGPGVMIDVDEDVVAALPPGCQVWRMVVSARGPLGPDWIAYWVESEQDDARVIPDMVETAKLHPNVVIVSDGEPSELADLLWRHLPWSFEIPTHSLTAHSHIAGSFALEDEPAHLRRDERPDAGLS